MSHADLLIEIACEELPARFVMPLAQALSDGLKSGLSACGVTFADARILATPRRLALLLKDVATQQPDQIIERRGPALAAAYRDGQATKAAEGFARGCGVSLAELETLETDKGAYLNFRQQAPGLATSALLQAIFEQSLKSMDGLVPKRMRWGTGEATFVRPVHSLLALLGEDIVPLSAFGLHSDRLCSGHRFHAPETIRLERASDYVEKLEAAFVLADFTIRRERIRSQVQDVSGGRALINDALLDEVTALVEWPEPVLGQFDADFLQLPEEVIVTTIQEHQRYFPVYAEDGKISREFVTISNIRSRNHATVVSGNEKVVRPRLQDALFFWQQDLKADFSDWLKKLENVTYIKGLGSLADKIGRMQSLTGPLASAFSVNRADALRAAGLAKLDLASMAVFEMPELQGIMGGYYARHKGEAASVAQAIAEHYQPQGPDDAIPASSCGAVIALSDKLDSLICLFSKEKLRPTSSKDPYGARRAALGVVRILAGFEQNLALDEILQRNTDAQSCGSLLKFLQDRLRVWLLAQNFDARIVESVLTRTDQFNVYDALLRCQALQQMQDQPAFEQLAAANKRIRNILGDTPQPLTELAGLSASLQEEAEVALLECLRSTQAEFEASLAACDYLCAMHALAQLSDPITRFFEDVLVNADDAALRQARHALLGIFEQRCGALADFAALSRG